MKAKRRLEITEKTHELTIVRFGRTDKTAFCAVCGTHTRQMSAAESVGVLSLSERAIFRLAENGQIHSRETSDGFLRLCAASLAAWESNQNIREIL